MNSGYVLYLSMVPQAAEAMGQPLLLEFRQHFFPSAYILADHPSDAFDIINSIDRPDTKDERVRWLTPLYMRRRPAMGDCLVEFDPINPVNPNRGIFFVLRNSYEGKFATPEQVYAGEFQGSTVHKAFRSYELEEELSTESKLVQQQDYLYANMEWMDENEYCAELTYSGKLLRYSRQYKTEEDLEVKTYAHMIEHGLTHGWQSKTIKDLTGIGKRQLIQYNPLTGVTILIIYFTDKPDYPLFEEF
jgi:hypothetical protein